MHRAERFRMKVFSITVGGGLVLLSLLACGVYLIAILDPVGSRPADDNDPFGPPPSRLESSLALSVSLAMGAAGVYLVRRPFHSRHVATNVAQPRR